MQLKEWSGWLDNFTDVAGPDLEKAYTRDFVVRVSRISKTEKFRWTADVHVDFVELRHEKDGDSEKGEGAKDENYKGGRPSGVDGLWPAKQSKALKERWAARSDGLHESYDSSQSSHFIFPRVKGSGDSGEFNLHTRGQNRRDVRVEKFAKIMK